MLTSLLNFPKRSINFRPQFPILLSFLLLTGMPVGAGLAGWWEFNDSSDLVGLAIGILNSLYDFLTFPFKLGGELLHEPQFAAIWLGVTQYKCNDTKYKCL